MISNSKSRSFLFILAGLLALAPVQAETLNVAVASNFAYTLKLLAVDFEEKTGHHLRISSASTGKLYTQINNGAPFDVFLSADEKHPQLLVSENMAIAATQYVYASGAIVLLSNLPADGSCQQVLTSPDLLRLSIANPRTAPYGAAAQQVMEKLKLWHELQPRLVQGENIAQTLKFVSTKNAQAGFVAKSMLSMGKEIEHACIWDIPPEMYAPIRQEMVILNKAGDKASAPAFLQYMQSPAARKIIEATGYLAQ